VIALDATTQSIEIQTSQASTTIDWTCSWVDTTATTFVPGSSHGTITGVSAATTIVPAPAAATYRGIKHIAFRNRHASLYQDVIVKKNVSASLYQIVNGTILKGECLIYEEGAGWNVHKSDGRVSTNNFGANGAPGATGGPGIGTTGWGYIDFGPGASDAQLVVTGQAAIGSGDVVEAWLKIGNSAAHTADEHRIETIGVKAGSIVAGTGFTIFAYNTNNLAEPDVSPLARDRRVGPGGGLNADRPDRGGKATLIYDDWLVWWRWS